MTQLNDSVINIYNIKKNIKSFYYLKKITLNKIFFFFYSLNTFFLLYNFFFSKHILNVNLNNLLDLNTKIFNVDKNNYSFFLFFIKNFQKKSKKNIFIFIKKLSFLSLSESLADFEYLLEYLEKKFYKYQVQIGRGFFLREFFESLFFFFIFKDCYFFSNWLKKTAERINFKKHKVFFFFISYFLSKHFNSLSSTFGVLGFKMSVSGKISSTGSSKKKRFLFKIGKHSSTNKSLKLSYNSSYIWTSQGSLGINLGLFFN